MGDHHHGGTLGFDEVDEQRLQFCDERAVERHEGFVEQQQPGVDREGAGERDAALHAAGQFVREGVAGTAQPDLVEEGFGALDRDAGGDGAQIVECRQPRQQARVLQHEAGHRRVTGGDIVDQDLAVEVGIDAADHPEEARFADAGSADERDYGVRRDVEAEVAEQRHRAGGEALVADADAYAWAGRHRRTLRSSGRITRYSNARTTRMNAVV